MAISIKTTKIIWGTSASRCSFPDCRKELVIVARQGDESIVGDLCHIVARSYEGARGDSLLTREERDRADNLILLCKNHHKSIDDQPRQYTVQKLKEIKKAHEDWVKNVLSTMENIPSQFFIFELSYNIFWVEEHAKNINKNEGTCHILYRNHIYQRLNRCNIALKSMDFPFQSIQADIDKSIFRV